MTPEERIAWFRKEQRERALTTKTRVAGFNDVARAPHPVARPRRPSVDEHHLLTVVDDAISRDALETWRAVVVSHAGEQSTKLKPKEVEPELLALAMKYAHGWPLIHVLSFAIVEGMSTEMHSDSGEYAVLFFPFDNANAPLLVDRKPVAARIDVKANRLVILDCTRLAHQQVVPTDGSTRYSVAFKFRLPEVL